MQPNIRIKPNNKMLQISYNPNNAIIMDLSSNENTLIDLNNHQLTEFTWYITHCFPEFWPCNLCQGRSVKDQDWGQGLTSLMTIPWADLTWLLTSGTYSPSSVSFTTSLVVFSAVLRRCSRISSVYNDYCLIGKKCFSKKHIPPYGALLTPKIWPLLGLSPKMGEDLSEVRPNHHAKFHADR